jgi:hypothetical protein
MLRNTGMPIAPKQFSSMRRIARRAHHGRSVNWTTKERVYEY